MVRQQTPLIHGEVFSMGGASENQNLLALNSASKLKTISSALRATPLWQT